MMVSDFLTLLDSMVTNFPTLLGLEPFTPVEKVSFEIGSIIGIIMLLIVEISLRKYPNSYILFVAIGTIVFIAGILFSLWVAIGGYFVILLICLFIPLFALFYL